MSYEICSLDFADWIDEIVFKYKINHLVKTFYMIFEAYEANRHTSMFVIQIKWTKYKVAKKSEKKSTGTNISQWPITLSDNNDLTKQRIIFYDWHRQNIAFTKFKFYDLFFIK